MSIVQEIKKAAANGINSLYALNFSEEQVAVNETKPEFEGDYTIVLFGLLKAIGKNPQEIGESLGNYLINEYPNIFTAFNIVKGFLNLSTTDTYWIAFLQQTNATNFGQQSSLGKKAMVEYSSPNTNKPLHLGHLRNNFLGWSVAALYKTNGYEISKTCIVNDRGVHICKSMYAWQQLGNGATPESTGTKGDHFVGAYYVKFNEILQAEVKTLMGNGLSEEQAKKEAPCMLAAQEMLLKWEQGDEATLTLWKKMNGWVYDGFNTTYKNIGSDFDVTYYESDTYLLGKDFVEEGLQKNIFNKREDGSVWIDLTAEGLDEKLLLRKDGTSVYITQDLGLAQKKYDHFNMDESIYVIADEQNYHMDVLKKICIKLGIPKAAGIHHLSYGMVELTSGKMKSREGTVVDADDLLEEMKATAKATTEELGKVKDFDEAQLNHLYHILALGALKFYLLRVNPKKRMVFNPTESIDMHGFTGPFVQYTHARIKSILRQASIESNYSTNNYNLNAEEKALLLQMEQYPTLLQEACKELDPSMVALYVFNLAKNYNSFYNAHSVLKAENIEAIQLRLKISSLVAHVLQHGLGLLGIHAPEKM
jgi:arginyl-tRNA synthetase